MSNFTYGPCTVSRIVSRPVTDQVTGAVTTFLSIYVRSSAENTPNFWAFADDFASLPQAGDQVVLTVVPRAKVNPDQPNRARLSFRCVGFTTLAAAASAPATEDLDDSLVG